jgi:CheY-like chemotaxis protein
VKKRILHIDDDQAILKIVETVLSREPTFETMSCMSGEEGVNAAADWRPDLVLSDVSMPDIDGFEVLARLRNDTRTAAVPVVFTTARALPDDIADYLARGADGVIVKPFSLRELANTVRDYLDATDNDVADDDEAPELLAIRMAKRLRDDNEILKDLRAGFVQDPQPQSLLHVVHKLAGVSGIFGFASISGAAGNLERTIRCADRGSASNDDVLARLDELLLLLDHETAEHVVS